MREKGLRACLQYGLEQVDPRLGYPLARLQYARQIRRGKPYFGQLHAAAQGAAAGAHNIERSRLREQNMRRLLRCAAYAAQQRVRVVEVGSWAGWSAIIWAKAIQEMCSGGGDVVCVDPWGSYLDLTRDRDPVYKAMAAAVRKDAILRLFHHNMRASGVSNMVHTLRGTSDSCLPLLRGEHFHLVFIDGDHSYAAVKKDLENASRLVLEGGVLCGDDLDLQYEDLDEACMRSQLSIDYPRDPKSGQRYHPGVTLAVWEFFNSRVSCWDGLWAMRKTGLGWSRLELSD